MARSHKLIQKGGNQPVIITLIVAVLVILLIVCIIYKEKLRTLLNNVKGWFKKEEKIIEEDIKQDFEKIEHLFKKPEVYNIAENKYTYEDAPLVCASLESELATSDQVMDAYDKGATWCNYGWTQGQQALFPVQKDVWNKLQEGPKEHRGDCGQNFGVNGGFFSNPYIEFGVNCYGLKPKGKITEENSLTPSGRDRNKEMKKKIDKFRKQHKDVLPFNQSHWSEYSK